MSDLPSTARAVIIGAGIAGNSLAFHLAAQGWTDIVQIDKGPLPNPGGSTGHSSNFVFPVEHSMERSLVGLDAIEQYIELGVYTQCGAIEVARTEDRMEWFKRRISEAKAWGLEPVEMLSAQEVVELAPFIDPGVILGGFSAPRGGVVDSIQAGTLMREKALAMGALHVSVNTEVTGVDVESGRVTAVRTTRGNVRSGVVVIACGVWSPRVARMAGATIPIVPGVHQMIDIGPVPMFADTVGEIDFPIIRDLDTGIYLRQNAGELEIGSISHRTIIVDPDDIPSNEEATMSPTEFPFTPDDFEDSMKFALELAPSIVGDEKVGIKHAINGLLTLTPDGGLTIGETTEVRGLWSMAHILIKEGPGVARQLAEWIVQGEPRIDAYESEVSRFLPYQRTQSFLHARATEQYPRLYDINHPDENWGSARDIRWSPFHQSQVDLGAFFQEYAGWEPPGWYESNAPLVETYAERVTTRKNSWDAAWWSPIVEAEHLAMRDAGGIIDITAFAKFDITGAGAVEFLQAMTVGQVDVPVGRVVWTQMLSPTARIKSDLTLMRLGPEHFRIVTGGGDGGRDLHWLSVHMPTDGSVTINDVTSASCVIGLFGPNSRDLLGSLSPDDVSNDAHPYGFCREIEIGPFPVLASRLSFVGELGWELHIPFELGAGVWRTIVEAGPDHGIVPVGVEVYARTGRLEKSNRSFSADVVGYTITEAGLGRARVKDEAFLGKDAYLQQRAEEPAARLCTLTVDDNSSAGGEKRYMLGHEPILSRDGRTIEDRLGRRSYVTSAGPGPSIGEYILLGYLPSELAAVGNHFVVEYFGEHYPVTLRAVGTTALFDPDNTRMRG